MPPLRSFLLVACAAALLALPAAASAVSWPITPIVTGGKVTYSGGISGALKSSSPDTDEYYNENAALDFSQVSYAGDLFGGLSIFDDGGASQEVKSYTEIPGSGNVSARFRNWDSVKGYTWENLTCKNGGRSITPPAPARALSGTLHPGGGVGFVDFATGSTCSKATNNDTAGNAIGSTLVGVVGGVTIPVGGTPPAGASKTYDVTFAEDAACPPNGLQNCRYSYSGAGHAKVECAICLTNVELEQVHVRTGELMDVPSTGTIDGNRVFVTATFTNTSPYTVKGMVNWRERVSKRGLIDAGFTNTDPFTTFPAGQAKKVTFEWDTSGFAWEKGKPQSDRELEIRTGWGGGYVKLKVLPKPIVAVHGWNADQAGWDVAKQVIPTTIHPELAGRVYAVGDDKGRGVMNTDPFTGDSIAQNAGEEAKYIASVREDTNASHVDLVAHSMGGLISRYYIQKLMPEPFADYRPTVAHLVMLGTPNMGSPCADLIGKAAWGTPTDQLKPSYVEGVFNKQITDRRMVPFSLMAGDWNERTCTDPEHGDGVVAVPSAWWTIGDVAKTYAQHLELTDLAAIYSSFVKPRVGQDPDQAENLYQKSASGSRPAPAQRPAAEVRREATAAADPTAALQTGVARTVTVPAGGAVDVPIPVGNASALAVGTTAPASVSSSLIAPGGAVADTVAAGTDAARSPMRFQRVGSPAAGGWTLRLSQTGPTAVKIGVAAAFEGSPLVLRADRDGGRVTATLRDGGSGVTGATVTADLRSADHATRTLTLHDDGAGAYSAAADLPAGEWFGTVHAMSAKGERFADLAATAGPSDPSDPADPSDPGPSDPSNPGPAAPGGGGGTPKTPSGSALSSPTGATGGAPKRAAVVTVSLAAKQARVRRAPYRFTLSGRLSPACPAGTKVLVAVTAGRKTVAKATVTVTRKCTFSAKVKVTKRAKLRATAAVMPSASVTAAVSRPLALRAG
jgi:pimeloyl-ACP methyl ester carboxylesterase